MHIDNAELDRLLLNIHKHERSPPPPVQPKRSRIEQSAAVPSLQPAPQHDGIAKNRVFDDIRLLVEHLLLQPRDQHRLFPPTCASCISVT